MILQELSQQFSSTEWPRFQDVQTTANGYVISLFIPADIRWFDGHFPKQPVLAGVVQTHWAAELGKYLFGLSGNDFSRIDNLKFQTVILPVQKVDLQLEYMRENRALKFRYVQADVSFSEGKFVFDRQGIE